MKRFNYLFVAVTLLGAVTLSALSLVKNVAQLEPEKLSAQPEDVQIYGSVVWADGWNNYSPKIGLYKLPVNDDQDFSVKFTGPNASGGAVVVDNVYYATAYYPYEDDYLVIIQGYDMTTGEVVYSYSAAGAYEYISYGMDLDPITGDVYGIFKNHEENATELCTIAYRGNTPIRTVIAEMSGAWDGFAIDRNGEFYGLYTSSNQQVLYKIDRNSGAVTKVGGTGHLSMFGTDAAFDRDTNTLYWTVATEDNGYLTKVDTTTGAAIVVCEFLKDEQVTGLYIPSSATSLKAPEKCKNVNVEFPDGSIAGQVSLVSPSLLYDGKTAGTGNLTICVEANGELIASVAAQWGEPVTLPIQVDEAGMYTFNIYARNNSGNGSPASVGPIFVGSDTPAATSATLSYENGKMQLSWLPVTSSVNGGWIDLENLSYTIVRYPDAVTVAENVKLTAFSEEISVPDVVTEYYYTVTAVCNDKISEPAQSNIVTLGAIVPPYTSNYKQNGLAGFTVIDANNDNKMWKVAGENVTISFNNKLAMDDWLISPAIMLTAGYVYNISERAWAYSSSYPERLEVKCGRANTVEAMTTTVVAPMEITESASNPKSVTGQIRCLQTGLYYIGFHGISDADKYMLSMSDFTIVRGVEINDPGMVSDFMVTPDVTGELQTAISFVTPTMTVSNKPLTSITRIDLKRDGMVVKQFNNPGLGETLSYVDNLQKAGNYTYSATVYVGSTASAPAEAKVFVGVDLPTTPTGLKATRTDVAGEVALSWNAVTADRNGINIATDKVSYQIVQHIDGSDVVVVDNLNSTSYVYQAVPAGEQRFLNYTVYAKTNSGIGEGADFNTIAVGTPYNYISETFDGGNPSYAWDMSDAGGCAWSIDDALKCEGKLNGEYGEVISGLVNLSEMSSPMLLFDVYCPALNDNNIVEAILMSDNLPQEVKLLQTTVRDICSNQPESYGHVSIDLADYIGKTVQVKLRAVVISQNVTIFDNINVRSVVDQDAAVSSIVAPSEVATGEQYIVKANVQNVGRDLISGVTANLYEDGKKVESKMVDSLLPGSNCAVEFNLTMSPARGEPIEYYVEIECDVDKVSVNNRSETIEVTPIVSEYPAPVSLTAAEFDGGVKLSWQEPQMDNSTLDPVTEDYEDGDSFATYYGNWTFVDVDGKAVESNFPNIVSGQTSGSFWVWDAQTCGYPIANPANQAHSGSKCLFSLCRSDGGRADDWAISPLLSGNKQEISFWAKSSSTYYPEDLSIWYSTGSLNIEDFIKIEGAGNSTLPSTWTYYTVELPAGAKHFAFRSNAKDAARLMIDDVTYTPGNPMAGVEIQGFNVYRNYKLITNDSVDDFEYTDTDIPTNGEYIYVVTALYSVGESAPSDKAVVVYSHSGVEASVSDRMNVYALGGKIIIDGANGEVSIANVNGQAVYNALANGEKIAVNVGPGIYVVKCGNLNAKVSVR